MAQKLASQSARLHTPRFKLPNLITSQKDKSISNCFPTDLDTKAVPLVAQSLVCDLEARDKDGQTALISVVSEGGLVEDVKRLIFAKANVNAQNGQGQTALMLAAEKDNFEIVEKLIDAGASLYIKDNRMLSAAVYAVSGWRLKQAFASTKEDREVLASEKKCLNLVIDAKKFIDLVNCKLKMVSVIDNLPEARAK